MNSWTEIAAHVAPLEDVALDIALTGEMQRQCRTLRGGHVGRINFYTPTFRTYSTSELTGYGKSAWPAVSITGGDCQLQCDHCQARILEPMIPARTPGELWRVVNGEIERGARGMLLSGGSNRRDEVEYDAFYPTVHRIKQAFPAFKIALHTALVDRNIALRMEACGIDAAMMDVIGSQDTISQVYHLRRGVADFERSLECLTATSLKVVPHIVIGLHYGKLLGEWNALEIVRRHRPAALVLVVVMPFYAPAGRPYATPDPHQVGQFLLAARGALPDIPLLLGCARPAGTAKAQIDAYAVMAGLNGIAHPADGMVELAARLGREVRVTPACCSIALGDEVLALDSTESGIALEVQQVIERERERSRRRPHAALSRIPVVVRA